MRENDSSSFQQSRASSGSITHSDISGGRSSSGSITHSDTPGDTNNSLLVSNSTSVVGPPVDPLEGTGSAECLVSASKCNLEATSINCESQVIRVNNGFCETEDESHTPFDKRRSYRQVSRRLQRIRVLPALIACFSSLVVTSAVCGAEIAIRAVDISSSVALLCSSVLACLLASFAAHRRSHVLLVGLVMLEILFTLYSIAFASVGIVNVGLLRKRREKLQEDDVMQAEQRQNALKITRNMLIEQAVFACLYLLIAAAHCCAAASANHLRATVRPFDSRLRRKRQRARAMKKLNVLPPREQEEIEGTGDQRTTAGGSSKTLGLVHCNSATQAEAGSKNSSESGEFGEGNDRHSVGDSGSNNLTTSSSSDTPRGTNSSQMAEDDSTKTVEAGDAP